MFKIKVADHTETYTLSHINTFTGYIFQKTDKNTT